MPWWIRPDAYYETIQHALATAPRPSPPAPEAVEKAAHRLDAMFEAASENFDRLDRKAALVPAAVAAVVTFMAGRDFAVAGAMVGALGLLAAASGIASAFLGIWAFSASRYQSGPSAIHLALKTYGKAEDRLRADQGVVDALAVAMLQAQEVMAVKGQRLNASLLAGGFGIIFLALFIALGGVQVGDDNESAPIPEASQTEPALDPVPLSPDTPEAPASSGWSSEYMGASYSREAEQWCPEDMGASWASRSGTEHIELSESGFTTPDSDDAG